MTSAKPIIGQEAEDLQSSIDMLVAKDPLKLEKNEFQTLLIGLRKKRKAKGQLRKTKPAIKVAAVKKAIPDVQGLQNMLDLKIAQKNKKGRG